MELNQIKRMASNILGVGLNRIKIVNPSQALQAMTKDDIRTLLRKGYVIKRSVKGSSRVRARKILKQKKKSRRTGRGSKRGTLKARRGGKKVIWMSKVRALRRALKSMKPKLSEGSYRTLYNMIKGGFFRSKSHLKTYVNERKLLRT